MEKSMRITALVRAASCVLLLVLLAVCGYMGASQVKTQMVSIPLAQTTLSGQEIAAQTMAEIKAKLLHEREQEIALLDGVIAQTDATARDSALTQKTQITSRMEKEAQAEAVLTLMGFSQAACVCGAQTMTVMIPYGQIQGDADMTRILDAVSTQTQTDAQDIKIILVKK